MSKQQPIRIICVDDHPIFLEGMVSVIDHQADMTVVATARLVNTIGGGDWAEERLVPNIVRDIASGKRLLLDRGNSLFQWQHVLESARACLLLGQSLYECGHAHSGPWNFAPPEETAVLERQLAERFATAWGEETTLAERRSLAIYWTAQLQRLDHALGREVEVRAHQLR